jgi:VWFA-related protein
MGAQSEPTLRTGANLVLVDVVATDQDRPVHGLERRAFHVFEDGKEQPVSSFDEHQQTATPAAFMASALPANTYSNLPQYPPSSAVNVLLLDALNTPLGDQMRVRHKMIDYLESIKPGTNLAIFALSRQLRMVTAFTSDPGELAKALKNPKATPQQSPLNAQQSTDLDTSRISAVGGLQPTQSSYSGPASVGNADVLSGTGATVVINGVDALRQFEADQTSFGAAARAKITLDAMRQLAGYLGGIEGRKNVIWFSGSFPLVIFPDSSLYDSMRDVTSLQEEIKETADMLTAARLAVYSVDARGMMPQSELSATRGFVAPGQPMGTRNTQDSMGTQVRQENEELHSEQATLQEIADETGGRAYLNDNDLDRAVANAVENGSSYYTIAYVPSSEQLDGKYHKIRVSVDGERKVKLAYRHGYYADATDVPVPDNGGTSGLFADALSHEAPAATQILFRARVLPASDPLLKGASIPSGPAGQMTAKGPAQRYVIDLTLDAHGLTFNAGTDGGHHAVLELVMVAYDGDGQRMNFYQQGFQLGLQDSQMDRVMAKGISLRVPFDLPAGKVYLRIGVHDLNANRAGSLEVPLTVVPQ